MSPHRNQKAGYIHLLLMLMISMITQVFTLLKSSIAASTFGTTEVMDAFNLANSINTFLFSFVSSGVATIVIPEYIRRTDRKIVDTFITAIYGILFLVLLFILCFRNQLAGLLGANRSQTFKTVTAHIMLILLSAQFLTCVTNVTTAYFQTINRYSIPKLVALLSQILVVIALLLAKGVTIIQYTWILAIGIVVSFLLDTAVAIKCGWRYMPCLRLNSDSKQLFSNFLPIVFSTGIYQLSLMTGSMVSSFLETGLISVLSYSSQIASMVNTVLIGNLLIYIYPKIILTVHQKGSQKEFWKRTYVLHTIVCLVVAGFIVVGQEATDLLFRRGQFTQEASQMVYLGAALYIFGQQFSVLRDVIYRYFYASGDTRTPAVNSVIVSVSNLVLTLVLVTIIGFYGIILGTLLSSLISLTVIFIRFKRKFGMDVSPFKIFFHYGLNLAVMAATACGGMLIKDLFAFSNVLVEILVYGCSTVVIYLILSLIFNRKTVLYFKKL